MTDAQRVDVERMLREGKSQAQVAEATGVSKNCYWETYASRLQAEVKILEARCADRTIALHQAIGFAQESILPSPEAYNRWRALLGWHEVE